MSIRNKIQAMSIILVLIGSINSNIYTMFDLDLGYTLFAIGSLGVIFNSIVKILCGDYRRKPEDAKDLHE